MLIHLCTVAEKCVKIHVSRMHTNCNGTFTNKLCNVVKGWEKWNAASSAAGWGGGRQET